MEEKENAFAFNNKYLLEAARRYLGRYERTEASKIMKGNKQLIFTNQRDRPFTRSDENSSEVLEKMIKFLEQKGHQSLSPVDKAFLEWEFYNESEQRIIELVIKGLFEIELNKVEKYLFSKGLNKYFERGEALFISDLEEIFGGFNKKRLMVYKLGI
ncbi:MAG: hypothetical protein RR915_07915 [Cellulosilyticaceae bacterium]